MKNCSDSPSKLQELIMNIPSLPGTFARSWAEPNPTTGLAYHHNTIMTVYLQLCYVIYMYMYMS